MGSGIWQVGGGAFADGHKVEGTLKMSWQALRRPSWLTRFWPWRTASPEAGAGATTLKTAPPAVAPPPPAVTQSSTPTLTKSLTQASLTLGLATTTALIYPPAQVICLPLLLYLSATPAQAAYRTLRRQEGAPFALAETTVLALCLMRQAYVLGALSYWGYVAGQQWWQARQAAATKSVVTWQPPTWAYVQQAETASATPVQRLQAGDVVVVHTGEMVPVTGVVTAGMAWVKCPGNAAQSPPSTAKVRVGSIVDAMTIVQVGSLWLVVV